MTQPNLQASRTMQVARTSLAPAEALAAAKAFFARAQSVYVAFVEKEGPGHVALRGQGGEEVVIAARAHEGATEVTGSSYMFDQQVARFLSTLPPAGAA
ncbi:MAG: hypothetical protein HY275_09345 [Gemmatimonadetes bacterium]|nr:hypothetical protein [Gemmatimonadota bacterium]